MFNKRYIFLNISLHNYYCVMFTYILLCEARTSQTNSDQSKANSVEMKKSSTVETKKNSRVETMKKTENGEMCHTVGNTVEMHQISKVEAHKIFVKENENSEMSNSPTAGGHQSNGDAHNDTSLTNPTSSLETNNDHQKPPLKNQI